MTLSLARRPSAATFDHALLLSPHEDGIHWQLVQEYRCHTGTKTMSFICIPKDFVTDFASVPRLFWTILPPWGRYGRAAIVHDYLYATGTVQRPVCDRIFYAVMRRSGTSRIQSALMFAAVRLFGRSAWRVHRNASAGSGQSDTHWKYSH